MAKRRKKDKPAPEPEFDPTSNANYVRSRGRRSPHWRWETIAGKIQAHAGDLQANSKLYADAVRFHAQFNEVNSQQLARQYPHIYEAWSIQTQEEDLRWFMEAMITGGQDAETIAEDLELDLETVQAYEYLFFDVRNHKSKFYHLAHTLGGVARGTVDKTNLDSLLKMLALNGGVMVLKDFLSMGTTPTEVLEFYRSATRSQQIKNSFIAEAGRTVNRYTERHIAEQEIERTKLELIAKQAGLMDSKGDADSVGSEGLSGLGMTIAMFSQQLVKETAENEPRAIEQVLDALNGGNMKTVEPVSPPPASQEVPVDKQQEPSRELDGSKD